MRVFFIPRVGVEPDIESLVEDEEWIGRLRKIFLESGRASEEDFPHGIETRSVADEMTSKIGAMRVQ